MGRSRVLLGNPYKPATFTSRGIPFSPSGDPHNPCSWRGTYVCQRLGAWRAIDSGGSKIWGDGFVVGWVELIVVSCWFMTFHGYLWFDYHVTFADDIVQIWLMFFFCGESTYNYIWWTCMVPIRIPWGMKTATQWSDQALSRSKHRLSRDISTSSWLKTTHMDGSLGCFFKEFLKIVLNVYPKNWGTYGKWSSLITYFFNRGSSHQVV